VGASDSCGPEGAVAVDGVFYFVDYWRGSVGCGAECAGKENASSIMQKPIERANVWSDSDQSASELVNRKSTS
jgi:hypothetical protein